MLKRIFLFIFLFNHFYASEPTCADWGMYSKKVNYTHPLITHASGHFSYILQTTRRIDPTALAIVHGRVHLLCAYHLRHDLSINNTAEFIQAWKPIEEFMQQNTPYLHIALAYYINNNLFSVMRGSCGLYHWHGNNYTQPAYAETVQTNMRSFKETEYVSLCGVSPWTPGDTVFLFTTSLDHRSCPDTTLPWIQDEYNDYSAATKARMLPLHVYAPRIRLTTEHNKVEAEKRIQENCACIVVKNKKI